MSLGSLEACKRASLSLVSLFEVSHYARFARALAVTTFSAQLCNNFGINLGPTWGQSVTNLGQLWDQFGTNLDQFGTMSETTLDSANEHSS